MTDNERQRACSLLLEMAENADLQRLNHYFRTCKPGWSWEKLTDEQRALLSNLKSDDVKKARHPRPCRRCRGSGTDPKDHHRYTTGGKDARTCRACNGEGVLR